MSFPALKAAQEKLDAKRKELAVVFDQAGPERDMSKVTSIAGDSTEKVTWIRERNAELEDLKAQVDDLREIEKAALEAQRAGDAEPGAEPGDPGGSSRPVKSLGHQFAKSPAFKAFTEGRLGVKATVDIGSILNTLFETGAGWAPEATRTDVVTLAPTRPARHVVNFIPRLRTRQNAVKYMEETTFTNNAAERAEGAAYGEAALVLTERTKTIETIGVWLPATDEQLADEDEAEDYINSRLPFMIDQRIDSQILVGNGTTPNIEGTENVTGIQTQALGGDTTEDAIYKLFTSIRSDGFAEPAAVFIQPTRFQTVRLRKTADGQYIWGHPSAPGPFTIWGVPLVETTAVTSTKAIAGDYPVHSALYVNRDVDVQVTNAHSDFFINGKQAIRADVRVAMVHYRPKAFGEVTGL